MIQSSKLFTMASKFLMGFAAGVVVGILFAPEKGTETRKKLSEKGNELKNKFNDFIDHLSSKAEDVAEEVDEFAQRAKPQYQ